MVGTKKAPESGRKRPLHDDDEEEAFPRGGGNALTPVEMREARLEAEKELALDKDGGQVSKMRKKARALNADGELEDADNGMFLAREGLKGKLPKYVDLLKYKSLSVGMKVWGCVSEVSDRDLVVSLPNGLRGFVRPTEASDVLAELLLGDESGKKLKRDKKRKLEEQEEAAGKETAEVPRLSELFHEGQLVAGTVHSLGPGKGRPGGGKDEGGKRIELSLKLAPLNEGLSLDSVAEGTLLTACVRSIEDHGYVLSFGVQDISGFLLKRDHKWEGDFEAQVKVGQLLTCVSSSVDKLRKTVSVKTEPKLVANATVKEYDGLTLETLIPGALVNAKVRAVLEDGLMLSFLTYFTGTVDRFHLDEDIPAKDWKSRFSEGHRLRARILFIDPSQKLVGLTLRPSLVSSMQLASVAPLGEVFQEAVVKRIDPVVGLLLELPGKGAGYVHISNADEERVEKLEKRFRVGQKVIGRVIGHWPLEGLSTVSLKASVVDQQLLSYNDVSPGMEVKGTVIAVEDYGARLKLSESIRALCPLQHMSESQLAKPSSKFQIGARVKCRVLTVDKKERKVIVTYKKTLVQSKLPPLTSYEGAMEGLVTHGWITGVQEYGVFVSFYNNVRGLAHRSELGLPPHTPPSEAFQPGQVIKCRILRSDPSTEKLSISFITTEAGKLAAHTATGVPEIGSYVSAVVRNLGAQSLVLDVEKEEGKGKFTGVLAIEHLADHARLVDQIQELVKPGARLDHLLVIDRDEAKSLLVLSAKHSLLKAVENGELPGSLEQLHPQAVHQGYIASTTEKGCFVRFLGRLTGLATVAQLADTFVTDPVSAFKTGQSVRARVLEVKESLGRFTVSLKQSQCASPDARLLQGYFAEEERVAVLRAAAEGSTLEWASSFPIGAVVEGEVQEVKEYGVIVNLQGHKDLVGFATHYQVEGTLEVGEKVTGRVLDVGKADGIVDLTLKKELVSGAGSAKKKQKKSKKLQETGNKSPALHETVTSIVELVKDDYLVLSLPEHANALGFASTKDFNLQTVDAHAKFKAGQRLTATIHAIPEEDGSDRLLLTLPPGEESSQHTNSKKGKKGKQQSRAELGTLVEGTVTVVKGTHMNVDLARGVLGRVHITEVVDRFPSDGENPLRAYKAGQKVKARVVGSHANGKRTILDLSLRPSEVENEEWGTAEGLALEEKEGGAMQSKARKAPASSQCLTVGSEIVGYVEDVRNDYANIVIALSVKGKLHILDSSTSIPDLKRFRARYPTGRPVKCRVVAHDLKHHTAELSSLPLSSTSSALLHTGNRPIHTGDVLPGRISKILPNSHTILVHIGPHAKGRVHITELSDNWYPHAFDGMQEGQFVRCVVLGLVNGKEANLELSMRSSRGGCGGEEAKIRKTQKESPVHVAAIDSLEDLTIGQEVWGYVKSCSNKGCFVALSHHIDARVILGNLSHTFVPDPATAFPANKLVKGRILGVEPLLSRVEMTLRTGEGGAKRSKQNAGGFSVGDVVTGKVKRIEKFGMFIALDRGSVTGLCHISEVSDKFIKDLNEEYEVGDHVTAKILKIDDETGRVSLVMKKSVLNQGDQETGDAADVVQSDEDADEAAEADAAEEDADVAEEDADVADEDADVADEDADDDADVAEDDADVSDEGDDVADEDDDVPPLEVDLAELEEDTGGAKEQEGEEGLPDAEEEKSKNKKKREKKRAKDAKEAAIQRAEAARLAGESAPETIDDYERLVAASPGSSFVWIKYMAFMLSLAEVDKAREVAERALSTINYREEAEKLNVWVAYLNLENMHGSPDPKQAVLSLFQRALTYADPKKLYLALLGIYERTGQDDMADELFKTMTRKFNTSAKVWLRNIQSLLRRGQEDAAHKTLDRSLLSLPRRKHIKVISRAALLEFKMGSIERARAMFEGILRNYPKRVDLWSVYLDQEVRLGDQIVIRGLFERAICLDLPPKKMKFLFKKYLEYEKAHGDEATIEDVKQKAMAYVENKLG